MKQKLLLLLAAFALFSCTETPTAEQKIDLQLNEASLAMQLPSTTQLSVVAPEQYKNNENMVWVSLLPSVASVDQTGKVTAVAPGITTVYGYVKGLDAVRAECEVIVKADLDTKLSITNPLTSINAGESVVIKYAYTPAIPAQSSAIKISQSDTVGHQIVDVQINVDAKGNEITGELLVTALSVGKVKVKIENMFDATVADSMEITVNAVPMTSFAFVSGATFSVEAGESASLEYEILPKEAAYRTVSWRSSDPKIVSVDENGELTAADEVGSVVTIFASTDDGQVISCEVMVVESTMQKVKFAKDTIDFVIGDQLSTTIPLEIIATPSQGVSYKLYKSSDYAPKADYYFGQKAGVTILTNKEATAIYNGTQTGSDRIVVEITTADGEKVRDTCIVNVIDVSDDLFTCKPTYTTTDLGATTVFQARIANFTATSAVLVEVELYTSTVDKEGKVVQTSIETLSGLNLPVSAISTNGTNFASVSFAPIKNISVANIGTYYVRYKYAVGINVMNNVYRKTSVDTGAPFSL